MSLEKQNLEETIEVDHALKEPEATLDAKKKDELELEGKTIAGKYEILEMVGRGGMSLVYRARHLGMDKIVAVKFLHTHLSRDSQSLRRFKQEARASSSLMHSGIVAVHDCDETDDHMPYFVMDFLEGRSLSDILSTEGSLKLERFLSIMTQVCHALAHAHEQGVVHRDLKPSNIMVLANVEREQVKIVDFGIAKIISHEGEQGLTQTGELFGSPFYMSPEQCSGGQIDRRSDIYAMGCVMYEALSGEPPLKGNTVIETIHKHLNEEPPLLQAGQIQPEIRSKLELIILRCLAKDPDDRFQNMVELEKALRSIRLEARSSFLGRLGGAWNLASAKRRARRGSKLPVFVAALSISMLSVIMLLVGLAKAEQELRELENSRKVLDEISLAQSDFLFLAEASRKLVVGLMSANQTAERIEDEKRKFKRMADRMRKRLDSVDSALSVGVPEEYRDTNRKMRDEFKSTLLDVPELSRKALDELHVYSSGIAVNMQVAVEFNHLSSIFETSTGVLYGITRQAKKVERLQLAQFKRTENLVRQLSIACGGLNGIVMISLIIYFVRENPDRMKKLAEQAVSLSRKRGRKENGLLSEQDEVAELDSVLHELADALSEAEARERILLEKLKEQENQS